MSDVWGMVIIAPTARCQNPSVMIGGAINRADNTQIISARV